MTDLLPWNSEVRSWVNACERKIQTAYSRLPWKPLDWKTHSHDYNFGDITAWPLDASCITLGGDTIFLGSVKAAVNIEAVEVEYTTKISHVVTLCGNEIQVRGAPSDLPTYFERCGVAHIWWFIEDPTVKDPNTELAKHRQSAGECLAFWKDLMHVLWDVASYYWNHDIRFTPLFHCFGGINRSTAALCAWLVIWWDLSVEDAIDCVLQQRPSLRPWKRRAYVLYALRSLEHHKHAWRWEFETS